MDRRWSWLEQGVAQECRRPRECKISSGYYFLEAKWSNSEYAPSFKEHLEVSAMSSGFPTLIIAVLMGAGDMATKEVFDWASSIPEVVSASGALARFFNDIASYKVGKRKKDMASSIECYMKENGVTGEEAVEAIAALAEDTWRKINRACLELPPAMVLAQLVVNLTRTLEVIYLGGRISARRAARWSDLGFGPAMALVGGGDPEGCGSRGGR
ncbi:hypothetical protein ACQ4PT_060550 [Festuca glaucescens]